MFSRYVAGALWALMTFSGWQLVTGLIGMPTLGLAGLILAVLIGAAIVFDPSGMIWQSTPPRRVVRIADYEQAGDGTPAPTPQG
jgi:hypothetical protein